MKKGIKITIRVLLGIIAIPLLYIVISLLLSFLPVNNKPVEGEKVGSVFLSTNGVHLDIILPVTGAENKLLSGIWNPEEYQYLAFGWGDRNFYLNTPEWSDLTVKTAFSALFLRTNSLVHLTRYSHIQENWIEIGVTKKQLEIINRFLIDSFYRDSDGGKVLLKDRGYFENDDFYEATGYYTCFKSSNSWVNSCCRKSGIKACLWTPFDFTLIRRFRNK
jgi:uncharacterized protein (TIGR02117 family)